MLTIYSQIEKDKGTATLNIPGVVFNYLDETITPPEWKVQKDILRPVTVTYRYDKALDDANVDFISMDIQHKLPNLTKVRLIYESSDVQFDSKGKPKNFDEFIIIEGTCMKQGISGYYKHHYHLVEPIELFKYVRMETLSFTNKTRLEVFNPVDSTTTVYVKDPLNYLSIIQRILAVTGTKTSMEDTTWARLIKIDEDTANLLKAHGVENDEVFNENTLYDALFYIGTCINRVPVIYFNYEEGQPDKYWEPYNGNQNEASTHETINGGTNVLPTININSLPFGHIHQVAFSQPPYGWELYKVASGVNYEFTLHFERVDGLDKPLITEAELYQNNLGWVESQMPTSQADSVVCDVQNGVPSHESSYPLLDWYCYPSGVKGDLTLGANEKQQIVLPYKIREITEIFHLQLRDHSDYFTQELKEVQCFTYNDWRIQPDRENCCYYKEGEPIVYFGDNFQNTQSTQRGLIDTYKVSYYPLLEGKLLFSKSEKSKYQTTYNLTNTLTDLDSLGTVLKSYANENGGLDLLINKYIKRDYDSDKTRWGEAYQQIWQPGTRIKMNNGQIGLIASTSFTGIIEGYKINYQINTNFIKRNEAIRASQRIRQQGLDYDTTYNRYTNVSETISIGFSAKQRPNGLVNNANYLKDKNILFARLISDGNVTNQIQTSTLKVDLTYKRRIHGVQKESRFFLNQYVSSQSGKAIILNAKLISNFFGSTNVKRSRWDSAKIETRIQPFRYTDPFGEVKKLTLMFSKYPKFIFPPYDVPPEDPTMTSDPSGFETYENFLEQYPKINENDFNNFVTNSPIQITDLEILKDAGETLNITYQLNFKGFDEAVLTPELIKHSGLLGNSTAPTLYFVALKQGEFINSEDVIIYSQIKEIRLITHRALNSNNGTVEFSWNELDAIDILSNSYYTLCIKLSDGAYKPIIINKSASFLTTYKCGIYV